MITTLLRKAGFGESFSCQTVCGAFLALFFYLLPLSTSYAQVATNYVFSEASGVTYTEITEGTTLVAEGVPFSNAVSGAVALGFDFNFDGTNYNQVYISENGFLTFGLAPAATNYTPISLGTFNGAISVFGFNLHNASASAAHTGILSSVKYEVIGTTPNRVFVVQYKNVIRLTGISPALTYHEGLLNLQIRIYESSNVIETYFKDGFNPVNTTFQNAQVGLRGSTNVFLDGNVNNRTTISSNWQPTVSGTANNSSIPVSSTFKNDFNLRFTWTPCFLPNGLTATLQSDNTTALLTWTEPNFPPPGYDYEVRTSGNPGSGPTGLFASGTTTATSMPVTGLQTDVTYYFYIKSSCRTVWLPVNTAPSTVTVTPPCPVGVFPYFEDFEGVTVPGIPFCTKVQAVSGGLMATVDNSVTTAYGFTSKNLKTTSFAATNTWFFSRSIPIPAAGTYRISYTYGGTREQNFFEQKMKVAFSATNTAAAMATAIIADHNSIKLSPLQNAIYVTVAAPGNYYIGFNGYAASNNGYLQIDNISLDYGTCVPPTNLISAQVGYTSAIISWTQPATPAPGGYQYLVVPTASALSPINTTPPTGSVFAGENVAFITGLASSTSYQYWVRSVCTAGEVSAWSVLGTFTTSAPLAYCSPSGAGYSQDPQGITNVSFGSINNTTGIETANYGNYSYLSTNVAQNTTVPISITFRTGFSYNTQIWIDWNNDGDFNDDQELVYSGESTNTIPAVLSASFFVPIEVTNGGITTNTFGEHRLRIGSIDAPTFIGGPLTPCRTGQYQAFEDYTIYVIPPPPPLTLNIYADEICRNDTSNTVFVNPSAVTDYQVFSWSPSVGVNGSVTTGFTFNPLQTTVYTLTATQTSGNLASNSVRFTVNVNQPPTNIVLNPPSVSTCSGADPVLIVANGGSLSGTIILQEDFNGATNDFITVNNSTGGSNPAASAWTLRPGPYRGIVSNDATQFYVTDGDIQGSGGINDTELISPTFTLGGLTGATLSFWHYFLPFNSSAIIRVQISLNGGVDWTTLQSYTSQQGAPTSFVNAQFDLTPYVGNTNVKIKFKYNDIWGFYWAIDNFSVFGSAQTNIVWSPQEGLFLDAAGTIAYSGQSTSFVYAKPSAPEYYTATAFNPSNLCETSTDVFVGFITAGTASGAQSSCNPSDFVSINLSGNSGTIIGWEAADDVAFTVNVTPIANTTTTLTPAEFGSITSGRYFRAVVGAPGCSTIGSTPVLISVPSTVWNGAWSSGAPTSGTKAVFDIVGSYAVPTDLSACTVEIVSGTITIPSNRTLWVKNKVIVHPGATLIFENNASLVQEEDVANTGTIIYRREAQPMYKNDYTYWSSPVAGQDIRLFSPLTKQDKYFTYNNVVDNWSSLFTSTEPNPSHLMVPAVGYIVRAPENYAPFPSPATTFTGVFTGVPNNGSYSVSINATGTSNWNLIGNPYPSAIDIHQFWEDSSNLSVVDATVYLWSHNTVYTGGQYNQNDYAVYNYTGGVAASAPGPNTTTPSQYIASGQSFFIGGDANGVATFRNSMRVAGSNSMFFRTMQTPVVEDASASWERHRIWLGVTNITTGAYKQALVGYIQNATNGIDRGFDAKSIEAGNTLNLYTFADNQILTIQGKALPFADSDVIPLGYRVATAGGYSISLDQFDGLFATQAIYLEDLLLQTVHDLKVNPYLFTTTGGTHNQRFQLRFTNVTLGIDEVLWGGTQMIAYKSGDGLVVKSSETLLESVAVYDLRGRLLVAKTAVNALETQWEQLPFEQQVLLVKMVDVDGVEVVRKVVF